MATTTKTLTPTNLTVTLPDMTERPDASVLVDGIGKDADAINALSDQIGSLRDTAIAANTDLDSLTTQGLYGSGSSAITNSLSHCPISGMGFAMLVINKGSGLVVQTIFVGISIYSRSRGSTSWGSWYSFTGTVVS